MRREHTMAEWKRNDGYSGCKTAYFGDIAIVICEPEPNGTWGYQAFDEGGWDAVETGECEYEGYGFKSEHDVIAYVGDAMAGQF